MDSELKEILKGIKGNRDFYPEDYAEYKVIFDAMHNISKQFGYELYEGPILEYAKLIEYKSGQNIATETYRLLDREKRKLVLRPEMTPSLARLIVNQHQRYPKPIRWYCLPRIFRDETPQRGRVKEHFQLNADIIGVNHPAADAEIIALTTSVIKTAGLKDGEFVCVINSRELLQSYLEFLDIKKKEEVIRIIDAKGKYVQNAIEADLIKKGFKSSESKVLAQQFRTIWQQDPRKEKNYPDIERKSNLAQYLDELMIIEEREVKAALEGIGLSAEQTSKVYDFTLIKGIPQDVIVALKSLEVGDRVKLAIKNMEELLTYLEPFDVLKNCEFDMSIARGLDYYTGVIFEFLDRTGSVARAIAGGGRYDQLVENFGGGKIPATGIGMGETVLHSILKKLNRFPSYKHPAEVYVAAISEDVMTAAAKIAQDLRKDFSVIFNPFGWKLSRQL
ncbi:MAG: histidine--tRNA ligase family protein, partial [Candidatus Heimdallarchaeota archaeon]|nr:histidine--tRNA ligase family protein [Candidatus Heimdallarchaeota archaeon]MCK4611939.1 histidine--tRNA ligase family protein [Candidatus Heimdallarchaeota archaeon]